MLAHLIITFLAKSVHVSIETRSGCYSNTETPHSIAAKGPTAVRMAHGDDYHHRSHHHREKPKKHHKFDLFDVVLIFGTLGLSLLATMAGSSKEKRR